MHQTAGRAVSESSTRSPHWEPDVGSQLLPRGDDDILKRYVLEEVGKL